VVVMTPIEDVVIMGVFFDGELVPCRLGQAPPANVRDRRPRPPALRRPPAPARRHYGEGDCPEDPGTLRPGRRTDGTASPKPRPGLAGIPDGRRRRVATRHETADRHLTRRRNEANMRARGTSALRLDELNL
jgi:hypothetical protein